MKLPHPWHCQCTRCKPDTEAAPIGVVAWLIEGAAIVRAASWIEAREACQKLGFEPVRIERCPKYQHKKSGLANSKT